MSAHGLMFFEHKAKGIRSASAQGVRLRSDERLLGIETHVRAEKSRNDDRYRSMSECDKVNRGTWSFKCSIPRLYASLSTKNMVIMKEITTLR